ncbi:MAG: AmmeMemoRadiSam system protein B [Desulfobulbaceae bacterium]|nr:AmmeMemoRadiSam system protein B [Desulfobulbaceae bacterium]
MIGKRLCFLPLYCLLGLMLFLGLECQSALALQVREPVWAGSFYPADPAALRDVLAAYTRQAEATPADLPDSRLRALVIPHAGYPYAGFTAAHVGQVLKPGIFQKVILVGPDHRVGFTNGAIGAFDYYRTPLGRVRLHRDAATLLTYPDLFRNVPESDRSEHSLEVPLTFLQYYLGKFKLVPLVLGTSDTSRMAEALAPLIDRQTLLVSSSDLSHYLPYESAVAKDRQTISQILSLDSVGLAGGDNDACGKSGLLVLLELARRNHWQPRLLHYSNSGDTAGDRDRVVGYAALAFYESEKEATMTRAENLTPAQGRELVKLARQTIAASLKQPPVPATSLADPVYQEKRGVFVTLHKQGQLRGCIGSLSGYRAIADGVREHALNAAFNDQRFRPVTSDELPALDIEVSILTEPKPLAFRDGADLLARLRPGIDGVILSRGGLSATFLPQVWEQLPEPEAFLGHLCQKAGLPAQDWRRPGLEVMTYQVQYFAEER